MAEQRFTKEDLRTLMGRGSMSVESIKIKTEEGLIEDFEELVIEFEFPPDDKNGSKGKISGMFG